MNESFKKSVKMVYFLTFIFHFIHRNILITVILNTGWNYYIKYSMKSTQSEYVRHRTDMLDIGNLLELNRK